MWWLTPLTLIFSDALLAILVWLAAYILQSQWGAEFHSMVAVATVVPSVVVWIGIRLVMNLYPGYGLNAPERLRRHTLSVFVALAILAILAIFSQVGDLLARLLLGVGFAGLLFLAPLVQALTRWVMWKRGFWGRSAMVIGYKETSARTVKILKAEWQLGYEPVAVFDRGLVPTERRSKDISAEETVSETAEETLAEAAFAAHIGGVDTVIFAMPYTRRAQLAALVDQAGQTFRHVVIIPNLAGLTNSAVTALDLAGTFAVEMKHNLLNPWALRMKRALDLFGTVVGGVLISPILVMIAVLLKLDSPGPVFYGHRRLGTKGKHFCCWKFRSMHTEAERRLDEYLSSDPDLRAEWEYSQKLRDDPRVTRVGRFLRRTSLDELPQLWNVLRGEMSLVGARPIVDAERSKYGEVYELYKRTRPGITGFWQVSGRSNVSYPERIAMDAYYVRNWSIWLDLIVLARTVKVVLLKHGAH